MFRDVSNRTVPSDICEKIQREDKTMKRLKKALSMVLALAMVMTSLSVTTFGADPTWKSVKGSDAITGLVAGQTYYFKLSGATYTSSGVGAIKIPEGAEVHIDINGQRFYTNATGRSHIINNGTLYITNSAGVDKGEIIGNSNTKYPVIDNAGTLSITDCLVAQGSGGKGPHNSTPAETTGVGAIRNTGTLSMKNCIICSKIVNTTGTITPITDGFYFDDMSKYVEKGYLCVSDTSTYTCRYTIFNTTVASVTVNGEKTDYSDINEAKTAVETASGTVTYEIIDDCGEDPYAWRNDLAAMINHDSENVYSNDLSKIIDKAKSLTSDGSTVDITLLDDCTISSSMDFFDEWSETIKRTINFDLNGFNIISASGTGSIFGMAEQGYLNIIDSVGDSVINANGRYLLYIPGYSSVTKVYGGSFIGLSKLRGTYCNEGQLNFYGGTYNVDPSDYVTDKNYYAYPGDGTWTVKHKIFAVTIAGKGSYYPYASEAVSAILASDSKIGSITLAEDVQLDDTLLINDKDANITLNLNGCVATPAKGKAFADLQAGTLTINNGTIDFTGCGDEACIKVGKDLALEINDVTFKGAETYIKSSGTVFIDGEVVTSGIVVQDGSSLAFYSIQALIADEIKFNFVVNGGIIDSDKDKKVKLQYTVDTLEDGVAGRETITLEPVKIEKGQYFFEFNKGLPQWAVDSDLELKVLLGEDVKLERGYTVQDYYNTLNAVYPDNTLLNTVAANQIKFAEELQKIAFGASTIEYAGWEEDFISVAVPTEADNVKESVDMSGFKKDVAQILTAYGNVVDRVTLMYDVCYPGTGAKVSVVDSKGATVPVEGADVEVSTKDSPWRVTQSKLSPLDYGEKFTITFAEGDGKIVHAIYYSVNSYCYSLYNNEASTQQVKDIALALYRYGLTASTYTKETDPDAQCHYGEVTYKWAPHYVSCTASRKCIETGEIQTETAEAYKTVTKEAEGNLAEEYTMTARFVNPAFRTQVHEAYPDPKALTPKEQQNPQNIAYEKHLILNADGSYGGTTDKDLYGEGTPKNGALDQVDEDGNYTSVYYAVNDYYNLKSTATRVILPKFQSYQQTMQYSDGIACALMALNYMGEDVADKYSEENLVKKYEEVNKTTVKGNGTTQEGLAAMLTAEGFNAVSNDYKSSGLSFNAWVKDRVTKGQIVMGYFHMDRQERWMAIIGYDDMGTGATGDDIFIFANPYDVWDHYQDGYYNGGAPWMYAVDLAGTMTRQNESVAIIPKNPVSLEYDYDNDPVLCYPSMGERHLLYNLDGTWGGAVNEAVYGGGGTQNGQVYYAGEGYRSREHFEYNYFAFPDIYNMEPDEANGRYVLPGWSSFEQTMSSSCGLSSTLNTLNYLGYDFSELSNVLSDIMDAYGINGPEDLKVPSDYDILQNIVNGIEEGDHSKVQEAILAIYTLNDDYFSSHTSTEDERDGYLDIHGLKGFNNYGGVGVGNLQNVPKELGFKNTEYGRYYSSTFKSKGEECMPFPTYESFLEFAIENLDGGQPIIFCGPNHWRVIIGLDTMGTADTRDDIIFLGDSSDGWDHFQNGVDTEPARTWYAKWFNGGKNTNQQYLLIK